MTLELPKLGPPELQVSAAPPEQRKSRTCETSPGPPALWGPVAYRHRRGGRHLAAPEHADGARTSTRLHPQPRGDEQVQPELLAHARAAREVNLAALVAVQQTWWDRFRERRQLRKRISETA